MVTEYQKNIKHKILKLVSRAMEDTRDLDNKYDEEEESADLADTLNSILDHTVEEIFDLIKAHLKEGEITVTEELMRAAIKDRIGHLYQDEQGMPLHQLSEEDLTEICDEIIEYITE